MTYTVAILEISHDAYNEIAYRLRSLGYPERFLSDGGIDMTHIALKGGAQPIERNEIITEALKRKTEEICRTPETARAYLVKLGTHRPDGTLTPAYGGDTATSAELRELFGVDDLGDCMSSNGVIPTCDGAWVRQSISGRWHFRADKNG